MSLDEARVWLTMNESGLGSIVSKTRCEMHCLTWFYAVKFLTFLSSDPFIMQFFTILVGTFCFSLIALYSPFTITEKILFLLNYYFLFEYNILARPYVLMTTGVLLVSHLYSLRMLKPVPFLLAILLLANSTYFGIFLSFPFMGLFLFEYVSGGEKEKRGAVSALSLVYLLVVIFYALPLSSSYSCINLSMEGVSFGLQRFLDTAWDLGRSFFLIATDTWNEHILDNYPDWKNVFSFFWAGFILFTCWLFRKDKKVLFIYASSVFIIFSYRFSKPIYFGSFLRHLGSLTIVYVSCMWIMRRSHDGKILRMTFLIFLLAEAYSGVRIYIEDFNRKFGHGPEVHQFISRPENRNSELVPDSLFFSSTYLVYSDRTYYNYIDGKRARYYSLGRDIQHVPISGALIRGIHVVVRLDTPELKKAIEMADAQTDERVLVIFNYPVSPEFINEMRLRYLTEFTGAVNAHEDFFIYVRD